MARLHELMFSSRMLRLNFLFRKVSKNMSVEVMSQISELTHPPLDQGEAMMSGTRYPSPVELSRAFSGSMPGVDSSSSRVTDSSAESRPDDGLPEVRSCGLGAAEVGAGWEHPPVAANVQ